MVGLGYDVQGNLANKSGQKYTFDYGNRLRDVTGKESYRYDGLGRRVLAWSSTLGNIVSVYTKDGQLWYQNDQRRGANLSHIYLGGSLVAIREMVGSAQTIKYQHTDALGTPIAVTGANRALVQTSEYEPYGQLLNRTLTDGPGFTGHVQDAATGLTYMQQRYYDPMIGAFLGVDSVTAYSDPVGMFNRYKYAANNPYRFTDPDRRQERAAEGFNDAYANDPGSFDAFEPVAIAVATAALPGGPLVRGLIGAARTLGSMSRRQESPKSDGRPNGVPKNWTADKPAKGLGAIYRNPNNPKHDTVRTVPGRSESSQPGQKVDHVVRTANGQRYGENNTPVSLKSQESHIPVDKFEFIPADKLPKK